MERTTIHIRKTTADKVKEIAKEQSRTVSAQIDFMITEALKEKQEAYNK